MPRLSYHGDNKAKEEHGTCAGRTTIEQDALQNGFRSMLAQANRCESSRLCQGAGEIGPYIKSEQGSFER